MSFTSVTYFIFVGISLLIYTIVPKRAKWCVLLGASAVYYVMAAGLRTLWPGGGHPDRIRRRAAAGLPE